MAVKYWFVAGNGSANWAAGANWYLGSGGTGGSAGGAPIAGDDVILDVNSGSGTLTIAAAAVCNSIDMLGFTGTLAGSAFSLNVQTNAAPPGNRAARMGGNYTYTSNVAFTGTYTGTVSIQQSGITFVTSSVNSSASYNLVDDFRVSGVFTLTLGAFGIGTKRDIYCSSLSSSNANSRTMSCNNLILTGIGALLTLTGTINWLVDSIIVNNTSASARSVTLPNSGGYTSKIYYQGAGSGNFTISGGTLNFTQVYIQNTGGGIISFTTGQYKSIEFSSGTNSVWNNAVTQTITINTSSINIGETTGIVAAPGVFAFVLTPAISFAYDGANNYTGILSLNGNSLTGNVTVNSIETNVITPFLSTGTITIASFGKLRISANTTVATLTDTSGDILFNDNVSILTVTGTFTFTAGLIDLAPGVTTGNLSCGIFSSAGAGTRNFGNDATEIFNITLTGVGNIWNVTSTLGLFGFYYITATNTTDSAVTFTGAGFSYTSLTFSRGVSIGSITIAGSNTFLTFADLGTAAHSILITTGTTQTLANFNVTGNPGNLITINSTTTGTHTLSKGGVGIVNTSDYLNIQHSIAIPANVWYAGNNSVNNQAVATAGSGWIFTAAPITAIRRHLALLGVG